MNKWLNLVNYVGNYYKTQASTQEVRNRRDQNPVVNETQIDVREQRS